MNLLTNRQHQAVNFSCRNAPVLPPLIVVSALLGGCNTTGSLSSTGSSEPGADEAADPASTLLLVADPATPLLVALAFPSKPLIVLLDHAERGVDGCGGRCMGRYGGVSVHTSRKRFYGKGTRKNEKKQRTKNEHEKKTRIFLDGIRCTRYLFGGIQYRRYLVGDIQCRRYLLGGIQCRRYLLGCLLYTSPSPRDRTRSRMPSSA